ncbi:MAG: hypothetical protein A3F73_14540 [Gallionellales bacterium RIFCSPLOWO2_12_FULL_59_22]|nr:MAG: hypothetical protein A3F73_14540 [Gallionellales bacterium RIFCSPLOWO2_12_FULL_59_22]
MTLPAIPGLADLPLRDRVLVVAAVALAHMLLAWSWVSLPSLPKPAHREMSVSVMLPAPPQPAPAPPQPKREVKPPELKPVAKPKPNPVEPRLVPEAEPVAAPVEQPSPPQPAPASGEKPEPVAAAPSLPDREPDYRAAYLNNPLPPYPMTARRMGWQGRVVLNVEVLASGLPGQVKLHQSSGHDVLDSAAIRAVSGWRFVAARQDGQSVTKWFLVPIPFILKEAE